MTRAVEVAPGVFVRDPESVLAVHGHQPMVVSKKDREPWCRIIYRGGDECGLVVHADSAEVAAKLWPASNAQKTQPFNERLNNIAKTLGCAVEESAKLADDSEFHDAYERLEAVVDRVILGCT